MKSGFPARWFRSLAIVLATALACVLAVAAASGQTQVRLEPQSVVEKRLKSFSGDNDTREETIHKWFGESGCAKKNLSEKEAGFDLPPNVVCVVPGETQEVIVVGAHTDKVETAGDGVVDNWSGASLLPSLLFSLKGQKRHHTFIFVGFSAEENGLVGSRHYVERLSPEERARIRAMVNMDSLGLAPTKVWASHADKELLDALTTVAARSKLPISTVNVDNLGSSDSESFARYHIPRVTLHSVTPETFHVLHSDADRFSAIRMADYYDSYRLIAQYLVYLDDTLVPARAVAGNGQR